MSNLTSVKEALYLNLAKERRNLTKNSLILSFSKYKILKKSLGKHEIFY